MLLRPKARNPASLNVRSQIDQAAMFPPFLCPACEKAAAGENLGAYAEEITPIGPQLVIPGCERRPIDNGKPVQLGLFG